MKSYRLVKEYPGSLELGSIIQSDDREFVEGYPEFWEEIIEKQWEIVDGYYHELMMFAKSTDWNIKSIKRLSDNVIFTVGDKIKCINSHVDKPEEITKIKLNKEGAPCLFTKSFRTNGLNIMKSVKIYPLFTTEDGVDIYLYNKFYTTYDSSYEDSLFHWKIIEWELNPDMLYRFRPNNKSIHRFSTRELAEKYVEENKPKPLFITDDGVEVFKGDDVWNVNKFFNINKGRICDPDIRFGYKHFSTEAAALNYVKLNKPIYSLNDILEMQQRNNIPMLNLLNKK